METALEDLLLQYRDMKLELQPALDKIEAMRSELKPQLDAIREAETNIKKQALEAGEGAKIEGVSVTVRAGYTRTSWNNKALTGYAVAHPELNQFRKESQIKPTAIIKLTK